MMMQGQNQLLGRLSILLPVIVAGAIWFQQILESENDSISRPIVEVSQKQPLMPSPKMSFDAVILPPPPAPSAPAKDVPVAERPAITPLKPAVQDVEIPKVKPLTPTTTNTKPEKQSIEPQDTQKQSEPTVEVSAQPSAPEVREGRGLLKLLEHGSGPVIEIAWPNAQRDQKKLHQKLTQCFGMRTALMSRDGLLYIAQGVPGQRWSIDLDRYSGFVRQPEGGITQDERQQAKAIRNFHGGRRLGGVVRIFPRTVDAALLGGVRQMLSSGYATTKTIQARYVVQGGALYIQGIRADGVAKHGKIVLSPVTRGGC